MVNFDCVYNIINDEEKRNVVTALIKEIEIYRNDESEYPLKRIGLNFPVFKDGGEVTELLWDKGNTVESYYIVEIRSLKRILDAAQTGTAPVLSFVDEVLRGTNTVERIAAATQILIHLSESGVLCFTATHDIEMTELLKNFYDNYHFEEVIRDGDISFPYELLPGRAGTRNAIRLLDLMGYDREITKRAAAQAEDFLQTGKWSAQTLLGNT